MKNDNIKKLTILIEADRYKSISNNIINRIRDLEEILASDEGVNFSFALKDETNKIVNKKTLQRTDYVSPENWDYWPG